MRCTSLEARWSSVSCGGRAASCGRPTLSGLRIASRCRGYSGTSLICFGFFCSVFYICCDFMSDSIAADHFSHHIRRYLFVFYALLFGTLITVGASYIPFGHRAVNIGVALFIACGKAFLVAGYFMHLVFERKMIYGVLAFTAFFFDGLMFLAILASHDFPSTSVVH